MATQVYLVLLQCIWLCLHNTDACNSVITVTELYTNLTSTGYPYAYENNVNCWWKIKASSDDKLVGVKVVDFKLESSVNCSHDSLSFYDGTDIHSPLLARQCGFGRKPVLSTGRTMFLNFKTDGTGTAKGFLLKIFEVQRCGGEITATSIPGYFKSSGYPYTYFNNLSCTWIITAENDNDTVVLTAEDLHVYNFFGDNGCSDDAIIVYNGNTTEDTDRLGRFCSTPFPVLQSSKSMMRVDFRTNRDNTATGFKLIYTSKPDPCNSIINVTETAINLTSIGYPYQYENDINCWWKIEASSADKLVGVNVVDFELESSTNCSHDSLSLYDGSDNDSPLLIRLCGKGSHPVLSTGSSMFIDFITDGSKTDKGFYLQVFEVETCGGEITATTDTGYITSPGYPYTYFNDMSCTWLITSDSDNDTVELTTEDLHMESFDVFEDYACSEDALSVYTGNTTEETYVLGKFCEMPYPILHSSTNTMSVEFRTNGDTTDRGFKLAYTAKQDGDCNITMKVSEKPVYIVSPGYPHGYFNDLDCTIKIISTVATVKLGVVFLDIEGSHPQCDNDSLVVYNGWTDTQKLLTLCGNQSEQQQRAIYSNGNFMTLKFTTNSDIVGKGFRLKVTGTDKQIPSTQAPSCGTRNLTATSTTQYLKSPGYPAHYYNNEDCTWTISTTLSSKVVRIIITDSNFEGENYLLNCPYDYVEVFEGSEAFGIPIMTWCHTTNHLVIQSRTRSLTLHFHTDSAVVRRGFHMKYFAVAASTTTATTVFTTTVSKTPSSTIRQQCVSSKLTATTTAQYLHSPGYPINYDNNEDCTWTISASHPNMTVQIVVTDAEFADASLFSFCQTDYVSVYDGPSVHARLIMTWCHKMRPVIQSTGQTMTLQFHSDNFRVAKGFKLKYFETAETTACGGHINAGHIPQHLTSPSYPREYLSNQDCRWTITALHDMKIQLTMRYFDTESGLLCDNDYVKMHDGTGATPSGVSKMCGTHLTTYLSSGNSMTVVFHSDCCNSGSGFDFEIQAGSFHACSQGSVALTASSPGQYMESPNYPFNYPNNIVCSWKIDSGRDNYEVHINVMTSRLEHSPSCTHDYVEAFDGEDDSAESLGRWCGSQTPIKTSTGRYMFLKFTTDGSITDTGFRILYTDEYQVYHHDHSSMNVGAIAGGVVGGIVVIVVVVVIIVAVRMSSKRRVSDTDMYSAFQDNRSKSKGIFNLDAHAKY